MSLWSFQGAHETSPSYTETPAESARSLKTQQRTYGIVEVNVYLGELSGLTIVEIIEGLSAYRSNSSGFPRKEVIQPQLPLRLPCYDFTPVTSPTFDGSLPKGWATGFGCCSLPWCDGRCVQGPRTYSPWRC